MNWDNFRVSFKEAEQALRHADRIADDMAFMLQGRLRKCSGNQLAMLKKELRDFNASTYTWSEDK